MGRVPKALLRHVFDFEPYQGVWGSYGAAEQVRCHINEKIVSAVGATGVVRLTMMTIVAGPEVVCPAGSLATMADGRRGYVSASVVHTMPGMGTPDHAEIAVTIGSEYGPTLGAEPVIVMRRIAVGVDRHQNPRYANELTVAMTTAVRPLSSTEPGQHQMTVDQVEVLFPAGTVVLAADQLQIRGLTYDVVGTPEDQHDAMTGVNSGLRVIARRVAG
jgi:hypothetical protein